MPPIMNATNPLTLKNLSIDLYHFDETRDEIFKKERVLRYVGIGVIVFTILVALAFLISHYHTVLTQSEMRCIFTFGPFLLISGLVLVGISLYKRFAGLNFEKPEGLNKYEAELKILQEVFDRDREDSNQFTINRPPGTRKVILESFNHDELKSFIVQVCLDHYDVRTRVCDRPDLIGDLKLQQGHTQILEELELNLPPGFVALFA